MARPLLRMGSLLLKECSKYAGNLVAYDSKMFAALDRLKANERDTHAHIKPIQREICLNCSDQRFMLVIHFVCC